MSVIPLKRVPKGACCMMDHDVDGNCPRHPWGVCANCGVTKPGEQALLWLTVEHLSGGGPNIAGSYCGLKCLADATWKGRQQERGH